MALRISSGISFSGILAKAVHSTAGATVFACEVDDPQRNGVIEIDQEGNPISLEEKPAQPRSNLAVTGLYFYENQVVDIASRLKPSARGELEITDVNRAYLERGQLGVACFDRQMLWLDTGMHESLSEASRRVQIIEERQARKIRCIEVTRSKWDSSMPISLPYSRSL